jgi:hypothetical protein
MDELELLARRGRSSETEGVRFRVEDHDETVDTEGARALAKRIAAGPPRSEEEPTTSAQPAPAVDEAPQEPSIPTVYLRPRPARRADLRVYVRGPDGSLERFNL